MSYYMKEYWSSESILSNMNKVELIEVIEEALRGESIEEILHDYADEMGYYDEVPDYDRAYEEYRDRELML